MDSKQLLIPEATSFTEWDLNKAVIAYNVRLLEFEWDKGHKINQLEEHERKNDV